MADVNSKTDPTRTKLQSRLVIRNIGLLLSGDLQNPILDADTVVAVDGKISAIGKQKDIDTDNATLVIDAKGTTHGAGIDRQPCASGGRRLDAASEPARLDRQLHARRSYQL